jgi:hypothetical protein
MQSLVENARQIFEVAESATDRESQDFALLIKADGGLHFVMESPFSIEGAAAYAGADRAFRVTRTADGVRVTGLAGMETCVIEKRSPRNELLRDQPAYGLTEMPPIRIGLARQAPALVAVGVAGQPH